VPGCSKHLKESRERDSYFKDGSTVWAMAPSLFWPAWSPGVCGRNRRQVTARVNMWGRDCFYFNLTSIIIHVRNDVAPGCLFIGSIIQSITRFTRGRSRGSLACTCKPCTCASMFVFRPIFLPNMVAGLKRWRISSLVFRLVFGDLARGRVRVFVILASYLSHFKVQLTI
jgi:hypothetical protein